MAPRSSLPRATVTKSGEAVSAYWVRLPVSSAFNVNNDAPMPSVSGKIAALTPSAATTTATRTWTTTAACPARAAEGPVEKKLGKAKPGKTFGQTQSKVASPEEEQETETQQPEEEV